MSILATAAIAALCGTAAVMAALAAAFPIARPVPRAVTVRAPRRPR